MLEAGQPVGVGLPRGSWPRPGGAQLGPRPQTLGPYQGPPSLTVSPPPTSALWQQPSP